MLGGHEDIVRYLGDNGADLAYIKKVNVYTTTHEGETIVFLINFKNSLWSQSRRNLLPLLMSK